MKKSTVTITSYKDYILNLFNNNHVFHIVNPSPWPLLTSLSLMSMALGTVVWFSSKSKSLMLISSLCIILCLIQWWRDVLRESTLQGCHTKMVQGGIIKGMVIFIVSEVMFFASIFWSLLHLSSFPSMESGLAWPPEGIYLFNPLGLPLLNTLILITSGFFVSWSQYSMFLKDFKTMINTMYSTILLGLTFSMIQIYEYKSALFTMTDSIYGSLFFFSTGFHGIHVIVGTTMLIITMMMMIKTHFSSQHMTFFNFASWYWHFVDVVWIFLYICLYWWPWS